MIKGPSKSISNKKPKKKPSWDNTVSDLNVYKLSPEEMLQRKLDHISKHQQVHFQNNNNCVSKSESVYDRLTKIRYGDQLKESEANQRKKIVSTMFTSEKELFDLFEQSEKALSTVESLFGDPLKRYKVNPVVTPRPNFSNSIKQGNTNNSNNCALNECSDMENESSKSEIQSLFPHQPEDQNDDLSKFRKFIEKERQLEQSLDNQRKPNHRASISEMKEKLDASTETSPIDESNNILRYVHDRLVKESPSDSSILDRDRQLADKVIDYLMKVNEKNSIKIQLLNTDINKNKELIDALTFELMDNNEKMKRMKHEYELFTKNVTAELSGMKSLFIKYLDQQVTSTVPSHGPSNLSSSSSKSGHNHCHQIPKNARLETPYQDSTEVLLNQQLNSLQIEHKETQKRLKNLLKIQDSISQISAKGD